MYLDDIKPGSVIEIEPVTIEKNEMLEFSKKYDPVKLHTDEEYAKKTRFGKLIAPGIMSFLVIWANYVQNDFAGEQLIAGKSMKIEWFKPVVAKDTLRGMATVTKISFRNEYNGILEIKIEAFNQKDELVLSNITESVVERHRNACEEKCEPQIISENATAYVDGSYSAEKGKYAYGCIINCGNTAIELSGADNDKRYVEMRNVAGEILASRKAIEWAIENKIKHIDIYYDYEGIEKWADGKWKTNKDGTREYKEFIGRARNSVEIAFVKVAAHTGVVQNEKVDALAKKALLT